MLITQFILTNTHFIISLFAALVTFAIGWLYFDAWLSNKNIKTSANFLGFLLLSASFIAQAILIEQELLASSLLGANTIILIKNYLRIAGYFTLIIGQLINPLQPLPDYRTTPIKKKKETVAAAILLPSLPLSLFLPFSLPILAATTGFLYLRRATTGLEHHLKPIGLGFFIISLSDLANTATLFRNTNNIYLAKLVASFGIIWIIEHLILLAATFVLGKWAWGYLLKRFETQLFMIFTTTTLILFLITSLIYSFSSLDNLRIDTLKSLETDVKVLEYTIQSKQAEILSDSKVIAENPEVIAAILDSDRAKLADLTVTTLLAKNQASLVIVSDTGAVIMRAEDPERSGESISGDPLIKQSLLGDSVSSIVTKDGVIAPIVTLRATSPIKSNGEIIGAVMIGVDIDNAYVDGVKNATGLDASIYADNIRSATTFVSPDGKSRWIGIKEETEAVKQQVLIDSKPFTGSVNVLNIPYFAAYAPLNNSNNVPVGMLFVGRPQVSILQSASRSIELTFITTAILLVLSIFPSYFISKYIVGQIR